MLRGAPGVALATTVGYTGLLGGPPAIGLLAEVAGLPVALGSVAVLAVAAAGLVLTVSGDTVRVPAPRVVVTRAGSRLQPIVAGFGHGAGVYARDLQLLGAGAGRALTDRGSAPAEQPGEAVPAAGGAARRGGHRLGHGLERGVPLVQPCAHVVGGVGAALPLVAGQHGSTGGDAGQAGQSEQLQHVSAAHGRIT